MSGTRDFASIHSNAKSNEKLLLELLKQPANKICADCGSKGTRWASWNIGVFLCIRCGGIHRKLGTHISKVKSVNLDKWTDEQVQSMRDHGNELVNAELNPDPERFPFPVYSGDIEEYIRNKYEYKKFTTEYQSKIKSLKNSTSSSNSHQKMNSPSIGRYPQQQKSLREMGFVDEDKNRMILMGNGGNLQETIDALLKDRMKSSSPSHPSKPSAKASEKLDHQKALAEVFGVSLDRMRDGRTVQNNNTDSSEESEEFSDFTGVSNEPETAQYHSNGNVSDHFSTLNIGDGSFVADKDSAHNTFDLDKEEMYTGIKSSIPKTSPTIGNPWASNSDPVPKNSKSSASKPSASSPFDDIDPFKDYNPE